MDIINLTSEEVANLCIELGGMMELRAHLEQSFREMRGNSSITTHIAKIIFVMSSLTSMILANEISVKNEEECSQEIADNFSKILKDDLYNAFIHQPDECPACESLNETTH